MLSAEKKAYFKKLLEHHLETLVKDDGVIFPMSPSKDENADPIDRATEELNASLQFRFRERQSNLVRKIRDALERLEDGTFGICVECEEKISEKRLEFRPIATLCIKCKERQEAYEKLYARAQD